ncbi:MAG: riboflavin synthase [Deltaproteobacteria bacterium]|nr:riboflavin synthase [Deltaproteobacteria bacterium]
MFTGIVESRGIIKSIESYQGFVRLIINCDMDLTDVREGDSICVDGACLTATSVNLNRKQLNMEVSPETLKVTTLGKAKSGSGVNLEKAMRADSRFGGHMVSGHVDCIGRIIEKREVGAGYLMGFEVDSSRYVVEKGSVAVDGVSLTVNRVERNRFWVMIIPHTSNLTGLTEKKINDTVNIEFDMIGKYVEKFVNVWSSKPGLDEQTLQKYGFI